MRQKLDPDNVVSVRRALRDTSHERDEHVFLLVERARVEAMPSPKERDTHVRQRLFPQLSQRVCKQLWDIGRDADGGLTDAEEAIDEGDGAGEEDAQDPGSDGGAGHCRVVFVVDDAADFCVGRVCDDEGGLDLHLGDLLLVFFGLVKDAIVD